MPLFYESSHRFDRPWRFVTLAAWNKYGLQEKTAQVIHVDILSRSVDPATGVLRTERLFTCKQKLPSVLEWIVGKDALCYVRETTDVDPVKKTMVMRAKNMTYSNLLEVEEVCTYSEHEPERSTTLFTQQATFTACGINISSIARKVEETCVTNFAKNANQGKQALEQVMDRILAGTANLGFSLADTFTADAPTSSSP